MTLKDKIRHKLEKSPDFVSGEELAREFSVSRAAVWKAVKKLKDEGFIIESVSSKGYRLVQCADAISADEIARYLNEYAKGLQVIALDTVDSTNNEAKRLLANGFSDNALILANQQTGGRGRLGRSFYSPKNTGIYMTFLVHTSMQLSSAVTVTTAASVAVVRALERVTDTKPAIKWVNDIYIGEKKVCGILTEAVSDFETGTAAALIIGIGINITTTDFPDDIKDKASSVGSDSPVRNRLAAEIANELMYLCEDLGDRSRFIGTYKSRSMLIGREIDYYVNNEKHSGKAVGIDDSGALVVEGSDGSREVLSSGEVTVRLALNENGGAVRSDL